MCGQNSLTDRGIIYLCRCIKKHKNIRAIGLDETIMGEKGAIELARCIQNWNLIEQVCIGRNSLGDSIKIVIQSLYDKTNMRQIGMLLKRN